MEKLKAKHNHKLTDILKVFIFGLFLIMPFLVFAPALLYISFNKNAKAEETTINVDEYKQVDFNQLVQNGNFEDNSLWGTTNASWSVNDNIATFTPIENTDSLFYQSLPQIKNSKVLLKFDYKADIEMENAFFVFFSFDNWSGYKYFDTLTTWQTGYDLFDVGNVNNSQLIIFRNLESVSINVNYKNVQVFNLTQMFGAGNEPTLEQFNTWYTNDYYEYTLSKQEIIKTNTTTETIQDVETQIANNWQQMWNKQIFKWTNETILYKGINAFSQTFGIFDNSYITNLITYELIIVMIYIVIDIILTMFKWLTHMIGEK